MAWPAWTVGKKLTATMWAAAKDYIDTLTPLRRYAHLSVPTTAAFATGVVADAGMTLAAEGSVSNDAVYATSSGKLVINDTGVFAIGVKATVASFGTGVAYAEAYVSSGSAVGLARASLPSGEADGTATGIFLVTGSGAVIGLRVTQSHGTAKTWTGDVRVTKLARLA